MPGFSWVTSAGRHNEHPPKNIQAGQKFVAQIIDAVMKSPNWQRTALFFTYDEHGGFYDHVPPPQACPPDDIQPILEANDVPGKFDRLGVRVPMIVISPYAKKHYVSHSVYDTHLSCVLCRCALICLHLQPGMPVPDRPLTCSISSALVHQTTSTTHGG